MKKNCPKLNHDITPEEIEVMHAHQKENITATWQRSAMPLREQKKTQAQPTKEGKWKSNISHFKFGHIPGSFKANTLAILLSIYSNYCPRGPTDSICWSMHCWYGQGHEHHAGRLLIALHLVSAALAHLQNQSRFRLRASNRWASLRPPDASSCRASLIFTRQRGLCRITL